MIQYTSGGSNPGGLEVDGGGDLPPEFGGWSENPFDDLGDNPEGLF